jgi:hypothetical protein
MAQLPIMQGIEGGDSEAVERWDAQAEFDVGVLISRYLSEHPPPPFSELASDLSLWSENLTQHGRASLEDFGVRRLQAV